MARTHLDLRVMVDANILIAGIVWPRWPYEVLQHALRGEYHLVLSEYVIKQASRRVSMRFPSYLGQFEQFLQICRYELVSDPDIDQIFNHRQLVRDSTDVQIALAAINAGVDYLVSEDKDLTAKDQTTAELRQRLSVMVSGTFLREVMKWKSDDLEILRNRTWRDLEKPDRG